MDIGGKVFHQFCEKILREVLDSIKPDTSQIQLRAQPNCPLLDLIFDLPITFDRIQ